LEQNAHMPCHLLQCMVSLCAHGFSMAVRLLAS